MDGLTALERELLSYVERLTEASEMSAQALKDLEQHSVKETRTDIASLKCSMVSLARSQQSLVVSLKGWIEQQISSEQLSPKLAESARHLDGINMD